MTDHTTSDAHAALSSAARAERRTRAASRWFSRYLLLMGVLAIAHIVSVEVYFTSGAARGAAAGCWALAVVALGLWAETHDVFPARAGRHVVIAVAVWYGCYLVALGPIVRWQAGTSLGWWTAAAMLLAAPFFVAAWRVWRRS